MAGARPSESLTLAGGTEVQADVVRRIRPELVVDEYPQPVEDTPLGCLRADIILACVDSRGARQYVNEVARSLGVSWIDAGVEAGGGLARVNVYEPVLRPRVFLDT